MMTSKVMPATIQSKQKFIKCQPNGTFSNNKLMKCDGNLQTS